MAAVEARAAWQRAANRYFVQEDAKHAPKLACGPASPSASHPEQCQGDNKNSLDNPTTHFMPFNLNDSNANLSPDTRWWLQLQPNYANQRDMLNEQLKALEAELDGGPYGDIDMEPNNKELLTTVEDCGTKPNPASVANCICTHGKKDVPVLSHQENKLVDEKQFDFSKLDELENGSFDYSARWDDEKASPWWRITDKDELALLVAQKSLHIENCDLPQPKLSHVRGVPHVVGGFDLEEPNPSFGKKAGTAWHSRGPQHQGKLTTSKTNGSQSRSVGSETSSLDSEKIFSSSCGSTKDSTASRQSFDADPTKAQLLEALCHSQTRARAAETAAQRAHSEKEHIIGLFFKQASHLFAYKQWFRLLQLETIYLQLKCKDNAVVPWEQLAAIFPWMAIKGEEEFDESGKKKRKREGDHQFDVGKIAFAVAFGLSLAGAGFFLGWTLGWMLPTF